MKCEGCLDKVAWVIAAPIKFVSQKPCMYSFVLALTVPVFAWENKKRLVSSILCASLILPNFTDHTTLYTVAGATALYAYKFFDTLAKFMDKKN